jgi:uncharacterized DUF497 family protein
LPQITSCTERRGTRAGKSIVEILANRFMKSLQTFASDGVRTLSRTERLDDREHYGEDRYSIIGMVDRRILYVAYTLRNGTIRIISARGAEPHEKRRCHEDNI